VTLNLTLELFLRSMGFTLLVTGVSFLLAAVLGVAVATARRSSNSLLSGLAAVWITILRGVPPLVWLFIVYFGVTVGGAKFTPISAAIITFGVVGSAYLAEAYRAGLDAVPKSQREALAALSVPRWAAMRLVILPQAFPVIISTCASYGIHLLKDTALASLIGVQEMTYLVNDIVQRGTDGFTAFFLLGLAYLALSIPVGLLARAVAGRSQRRKVRIA
jgi:polar amino acid transport system permease protein